jgi:DNA-binding response OmpR family regulator
MAEVFLLSQQMPYKILKLIQRKINNEGYDCEILKSPKDSVSKIPRIKPVRIANLTIDPESYTIKSKTGFIRLRKKEFELLQFLISNKNQIINRNTVLDNVWGSNCNPFTNTVDVHIASLRKKLKWQNGLKLKTIHGVGYRLEI